MDSVAFLALSSCWFNLSAWSRNAWSLGFASALTASLDFSILAESWSKSRLSAANWPCICCDELRFLRVGIVLHVLRGLFCFCLDLVELLRGGRLFIAAHRKSGGGKEGDE